MHCHLALASATGCVSVNPEIRLTFSTHMSQVGLLPGRNDQKRCSCSEYRGMLDIPAELLLMISTHMNHHDLRVQAVTSQSICCSLLPEYLCRRGLVLKDTGVGGLCVEPHDLGGYVSLGLWSISRIFHPPKEMYCSIPCGAQEAQSVMEFLIHFLLKPSNTCNLWDFHLFLRDSNLVLLMPKFIKM